MVYESTTQGARAIVLCVLSSEQKQAYQAEFERLQRPGLDFVFRESPQEALDQIPEVRPVLVVVGMDVGMMDGLEFVARLFSRYGDFHQKVIVLPDKGDPFSPVVQCRDPATRRSTTESIDFPAIEALVDQHCPRRAVPAETHPAAKPASMASTTAGTTPAEPPLPAIEAQRASPPPSSQPTMAHDASAVQGGRSTAELRGRPSCGESARQLETSHRRRPPENLR